MLTNIQKRTQRKLQEKFLETLKYAVENYVARCAAANLKPTEVFNYDCYKIAYLDIQLPTATIKLQQEDGTHSAIMLQLISAAIEDLRATCAARNVPFYSKYYIENIHIEVL